MTELEVLILELVAIYGLTTTAIAHGEIASLEHEVLNHAVEARALVVQRLTALASALLARAERAEVFRRLRCQVAAEDHLNASSAAASNCHIEENLECS